jgi:hypothetical protein
MLLYDAQPWHLLIAQAASIVLHPSTSGPVPLASHSPAFVGLNDSYNIELLEQA